MNLVQTDNGIPLVSVIVAVYNTEQYLEQCLNSLCNQTLNEIEIILVDDGSTDKSGIICDRFSHRDSRFIVIHKQNEGLSAARNDGIELARADYIMFVDSDDWVERDFCEKPYHIAVNYGVDMVVFQSDRYRGRKVRKRKIIPVEGIVSNEEALTTFWRYVAVNAWNKMYKRDLFRIIRYPVGHLSEDNAVTYKLVYDAKRVFLLDDYLYNYRELRKGSITSCRSYSLMRDCYHYTFGRIDDLKRWGYDYYEEEQRTALLYLVAMGRKAELSEWCDGIMHTVGSEKAFVSSWKYYIMYHLYIECPLLFDYVAIILGYRVKKCIG